MKTAITGKSWAGRTGMTVAAAAELFRTDKNELRATRQFAEFLAHNFGSTEERQRHLRGERIDWADADAPELLEYRKHSKHAFTSNVMDLAFAQAQPGIA